MMIMVMTFLLQKTKRPKHTGNANRGWLQLLYKSFVVTLF